MLFFRLHVQKGKAPAATGTALFQRLRGRQTGD